MVTFLCMFAIFTDEDRFRKKKCMHSHTLVVAISKRKADVFTRNPVTVLYYVCTMNF